MQGGAGSSNATQQDVHAPMRRQAHEVRRVRAAAVPPPPACSVCRAHGHRSPATHAAQVPTPRQARAAKAVPEALGFRSLWPCLLPLVVLSALQHARMACGSSSERACVAGSPKRCTERGADVIQLACAGLGVHYQGPADLRAGRMQACTGWMRPRRLVGQQRYPLCILGPTLRLPMPTRWSHSAVVRKL